MPPYIRFHPTFVLQAIIELQLLVSKYSFVDSFIRKMRKKRNWIKARIRYSLFLHFTGRKKVVLKIKKRAVQPWFHLTKFHLPLFAPPLTPLFSLPDDNNMASEELKCLAC